MFKNYQNPIKEKFLQDADSMAQKLEGFQHAYQQHAAGLLTMASAVIPPGHPAYTKESSMKALRTENDKLLKENLDLKKKLDTEKNSK